LPLQKNQTEKEFAPYSSLDLSAIKEEDAMKQWKSVFETIALNADH